MNFVNSCNTYSSRLLSPWEKKCTVKTRPASCSHGACRLGENPDAKLIMPGPICHHKPWGMPPWRREQDGVRERSVVFHLDGVGVGPRKGLSGQGDL